MHTCVFSGKLVFINTNTHIQIQHTCLQMQPSLEVVATKLQDYIDASHECVYKMNESTRLMLNVIL